MNWSKAKTILIICFLVLNVILGYFLYTAKYDDNYLEDEELVYQAENILEDNNIKVNATIPRDIYSLKPLLVEYENKSMEDLNIRFFRGNGEIKKYNEDYYIFYKQEEVIKDSNNSLVYINNDLLDKKAKMISEEEAKEKALEFLKEKGFVVDDIKLEKINKIHDRYELYYSKVFNNIYIENAHTKIILSSEGVEYLERVWLNVSREGEIKIYLQSAAKALLELIGNEKAHYTSIESIDLCYFFDVEEDLYIPDIDVKKGRAMPAWRVLLDNGEIIILTND